MVASSIPAVLYDVIVGGLAQAAGDLHLHVVLDLEGELPEGQLHTAVRDLIRDFPVLGCRYQRRLWRDRWLPVGEEFLQGMVESCGVGVAVDAALQGQLERPLDPLRQPPLRIAWHRHEGGTRLIFTILHQVADGAGALTMVREFGLRLFPEERGGALIVPGRRDILQVAQRLRLRQLPRLIWGSLLEGMRPFLLPFQAPTAIAQAPAGQSSGRPIFQTVSVSSAPGSALHELCGRVGCTVNDVLTAALAVFIARRSRRGLLGNYFTVNLRRHLPDARPRISNLSGVAFVILPRQAGASLERAAMAVSKHTTRLKRQLIGLPFALAPAAMLALVPHSFLRLCAGFGGRWLLGLLRRGMVVTNIGAMDPYLEPYEARLLDATFVGPFVKNNRVPVLTAIGFRQQVMLQVGAYDDLDPRALRQVAEELQEILSSTGRPKGPETGTLTSKGSPGPSPIKSPRR